MLSAMRHRVIIATLAMLLAASTCGDEGGTPERDPGMQSLEAGDSAYQRGEFAAARDEYREALNSGLDGARVLYNLGNAYYRTRELGRALACYERAARLAPRDRDLRANLTRALAERKMGAPAPPASWLHMIGRRLVGSFTLTEFALAAAVLYWSAAALVAVMLLKSNRRRWLGRSLGVLVALLMVAGVAGGARWWAYHRVRTGVIAEETAEIRSGPGESFEAAQRLHEGSFVRVIRSDGGWLQVVAEGGARGWVSEGAVANLRSQ